MFLHCPPPPLIKYVYLPMFVFVILVNGIAVYTHLCNPEIRGYPWHAISLHFTLNSLLVPIGDRLGLEHSRGDRGKLMELLYIFKPSPFSERSDGKNVKERILMKNDLGFCT